MGGLAYLTAEEMGKVDAAAIKAYGLEVLSLMENAGSATASLARQMLGGSAEGKRVTVLVGKGNNGGDGLVAARHLRNSGGLVRVIVSDAASMGPIASLQLKAVEMMGLKAEGPEASVSPSELLVDAMLGYNSKGDPREPIEGMVRRANDSRAQILAVDIPSGLDATTGAPGEPCIVARATLTLGFPKSGFLNRASRRFVGQLFLGDVSIPFPLYQKYSVSRNPFSEGPVVRIQGRRSALLQHP